MADEHTFEAEDDSRTFLGVVKILWGLKLLALGIVVVCMLGGYLASRIVTPLYESEMVLGPKPTSSSNSSGPFSVAQAFGFYAGLGQQPDFAKFLLLLKSQRVAQLLMTDRYVLQNVYPGMYNSKTGKLQRPNSPVFNIMQGARGAVGLPTWQPPNYATLQSYLSNNVQIDTDLQTQYTTVSFYHSNPAFAQRFLIDLFNVTDSLVRSDADKTARTRVQYLSGVIQNEVVADLRASMISVYSAQQQQLMMAQADKQYSAQILDTPMLAAQPSYPKMILMVLGGAVAGLLLSVPLLLILHRWLGGPGIRGWQHAVWTFPRRKIFGALRRRAPSSG